MLWPPTNAGCVTPKSRQVAFWRWFLSSAIFAMVDVENMDNQDMESSFKLETLICGRSAFTKWRDNLYCLPFSEAGEEPIYRGTIKHGLITNPVLGDKEVTDGKNAVFVFCSQLDRIGLAHGYSMLIEQIADELADNSLTVSMVQLIKRLPTIFVGNTSPAMNGMKALLDAVREGHTELLAQSRIDGSIERLDGTEGGKTPLSEFTEYQQYKIGQFYNTIGVQSVWNLKRERVSSTEQSTADETARYNIRDVVDNLNTQLADVNKMFGTNYRVKLNVETVEKSVENVEPARNEVQTDETEN